MADLLNADLTWLHVLLSIAAGALAVDVMQLLTQRATDGALTILHWAQRAGLAAVACALFVNVLSPLWEQVTPTWADIALVAALATLFGSTSMLNSNKAKAA